MVRRWDDDCVNGERPLPMERLKGETGVGKLLLLFLLISKIERTNREVCERMDEQVIMCQTWTAFLKKGVTIRQYS